MFRNSHISKSPIIAADNFAGKRLYVVWRTINAPQHSSISPVCKRQPAILIAPSQDKETFQSGNTTSWTNNRKT